MVVVVQINPAAIGVCHQFDIVVLLPFLPVKTEVGHQSCFVACRALGSIAFDEREGQRLGEETQFVQITGKAVYVCADSLYSSADTAEHVGREGGFQCAVDIDIGYIVRAVNRHGVVVPYVVGVTGAEFVLLSGRAIDKFRSVEADTEVVLVFCTRHTRVT